MGVEVYMVAVGILLLFAIFDLVVGVANDAVNFLNSSIGSKAAPYFVIMIIASLGILAGVTFSGGMMEVAAQAVALPIIVPSAASKPISTWIFSTAVSPSLVNSPSSHRLPTGVW